VEHLLALEEQRDARTGEDHADAQRHALRRLPVEGLLRRGRFPVDELGAVHVDDAAERVSEARADGIADVGHETAPVERVPDLMDELLVPLRMEQRARLVHGRHLRMAAMVEGDEYDVAVLSRGSRRSSPG